MFEEDLEELDTADLLAAASEFGRVQDRAGVRVLEAALVFADRNGEVYREPRPGYEQIHVYGGDGCPGVAEFAPIEFGAVMRMSSGAAAALIGEALALRHRLPRIWAAVLAGNAVAWRARKIAHACLSLSLEAAAIVDRRVVGIVDTVTPGALKKIVTAALWEADPEAAKAQAEAAARTRGVFVAPSDDQGTKRIWVRAAAGDVIRFDATINDLARALKILGDTDDLDQRRAKAIGWISDPAAAHQLLEVARYLARIQPADTEPTDTQSTETQRTSVQPARTQPTLTEPTDAQSAAIQPTHAAAPCGPVEPGADTVPSDTSEVSPPAPGRDDPAEETAPEDCADSDDWGDSEFGSSPEGWGEGERDVAGGGAVAAAVDVADPNSRQGEDAFTRRMLAGELPARLAAIKQEAHSNGLGAGSGRRNRHTLYVHLTGRTLATGNGVLRVEELGPLLASQLTELLGHDQIIVKPVIDLQDDVSVHAYEIPDRIREQVRLRHPVDMFPYSGAEATTRMDQDHITPYDRAGPPGQTSPDNLIPLGRLHHRAKTFGGWRSRRLPTGAVDWISPHGFRFVVDHTGTHPVPPASTATEFDVASLLG
ncbi:uncharacterized protein DUF222 [Kribbella sp. VKM Ac-2569]|uniref:HNH endonuclease signature motif containing protein n=1 Tax=Kribbella sp. VKM Ac-2569 TaxID=2512220 RepID=UPI00102B5BBF|nr:HNH endonuclease signature motif containing protein [Kribbella sp. VKM Ac-2569]RZT17113.1 uncharacterized protein DUF222 [Kribbella sp. VKM Ac-2569]